jgi:CBS domain-containing protein
MSTPATTVEESALLGTALALLRTRDLHRLPVVHEGRLVGILTGSDILRAMLNRIETPEPEQQPIQPASVGSAG